MELSRRFPVHRKGTCTQEWVIPARKLSTEEVAELISASRSITIAAASVFFRENAGASERGHDHKVAVFGHCRGMAPETTTSWHFLFRKQSSASSSWPLMKRPCSVRQSSPTSSSTSSKVTCCEEKYHGSFCDVVSPLSPPQPYGVSKG